MELYYLEEGYYITFCLHILIDGTIFREFCTNFTENKQFNSDQKAVVLIRTSIYTTYPILDLEYKFYSLRKGKQPI